MLAGSVDAINRANASYARDLEYLKEAMYEDEIDARIEMLERNDGEIDTAEELLEAKEYAERLSGEEDEVISEAEVDRILNADHDLTFNEMAGIEE
jgi:hypothetical protein